MNDDEKDIKCKEQGHPLNYTTLLQIIKEQAAKFELQQKAINTLRQEYDAQIEKLKKEQKLRIQEGKEPD